MNTIFTKLTSWGTIDTMDNFQTFTSVLDNWVNLVSAGDLINRKLNSSKEKLVSLMVDNVTKYHETKDMTYLYNLCSGINAFAIECSKDYAMSLDDYVVFSCFNIILKHAKYQGVSNSNEL